MEFIINTKEDILAELELLSERIESIERIIESKVSDTIDATNECNNNISEQHSEL